MEQDDLTKKDLTLSVLLPEGHEKTVTVHGSKPVMDVLVILCARYHLNPSDHVIELFSTNHNKLQFKPSSLIGSLEAELIVMKPKRSGDRKVPNMPEATVRLLINYRKSHKAVVRVSPKVPLAELMPAVCEKCEMDLKSTVLLRDSQSEEPLDLTKTLNDYGIRDVYAKVSGSPNDSTALNQKDCRKEKENRGILDLFRRSKNSAQETPTNNNIIGPTAASPVLKDQQAINPPCSQENSASEMPKKRRAPQPPSMLGSQSVSAELNSSQQAMLPNTDEEKQGVLSHISSTESSLKRNKRKAPPPPCTSPSLPDTTDKEKLDGQEDNFTKASYNQSSCFPPTHRTSIPPSLLMTDVLSELTDRMKSMEQKIVSCNRSVTHLPPASNRPPTSEPADDDPVVPSGCELLRHGSQRDGLNTFTVVPRRRPQSTRRCEFLLIMENLEAIDEDTGESPEATLSECRKIEKMEMSSKEVVTPEKTDEFESVVEINKELGAAKLFGKLDLSMDAEEHVTKEHLIEDKEEDQDDRDWIKECRIKSNDDGKEAKLKIRQKAFGEEMVVPLPPSPPQPSVCWKETLRVGKERAAEVKAANIFTIQNPNPSRHDSHCDPAADATCTPEPSRDMNPSSYLNSDTTLTSASQSSPQDPQPNSLQSTLLHVSKSEMKPSCELSSPNSASPFVLAVTQRVQSLGNAVNPSLPSVRTISSPAPRSQSVSSQHASSQKLYFQSLISQDFISNIPASLGPWNPAALPTSTAPPSVVVTSQARRQTWSSFSPAQLKNLEQD